MNQNQVMFDNQSSQFIPLDVGIDQRGNFKGTSERFDQVESYGGIIKELVSPSAIMLDFEMRLIGKERDKSGNYVLNPKLKPKIVDEGVAREYVDLIRSVVNDNINFCKISENEAYGMLMGLNYTINRWMMFQAGSIPCYYRQKISFEGMALASESIHKAMNGHVSIWSKGSFKDQQTPNANQGKGILDYVFPFRKRDHR